MLTPLRPVTLPKNETMLSSVLEKDGVTDVFLCGLATDICVGKIIDKSI